MSIRVRRDLNGPMRHVIDIGRHRITVDEAPSQGGEDAGPTPHDLYDAALGACKALTLVWYARRKGMALEDVEVDVDRDATLEQQGTYRLHTSITLGGDLTQAQRDQLLSIAARCPVHKLMTKVVTEITTEWKAESQDGAEPPTST
jgi:putative redox protein